MKVKDITSGAILESENQFVCDQWGAHPERYAPVDSMKPEREFKETPTPPPKPRASKEATK